MKGNSDIKISIIIPVYNLEGYIAAALRSCVDQTYRNIEVIVVNDGSTDGSGDVVENFLYDPRVKLYSQPNSGVSAARNRGIELANGDYLTFLDGDDTLAPDTVESFVNYASRPGFDYKWTFFPVVRVLEDGSEVDEIGNDMMPSYKFHSERALSCQEAFDEMGNRRLPVCIGGVFYKSGFIAPAFISGRFEDSYMVYELLNTGEKIMVIPMGCYRYLHRSDSFINSVWTPDKWRDYVRIQLKMLDTELRLFPSRKSKIDHRLSAIRYNLRYLRFKNRRDKKFVEPLRYFDDNAANVRFNLHGWSVMVAKCIVSLFR